MAYTAVPTAYNDSPGWSASWVNKYIKDNFAAGVPDIFTTKGDLAVATAANAATRLAIGADGSILFADSATATGLNWGFPGLAKVNDTGTQSFATTYTKLTELDNEFYDLYSVWASDRFTATYPGYYLVTCMFQCNKSSTTWASTDRGGEFWLYKGGQAYSMLSAGINKTTGTNYLLSTFGADVVYLADGEYIEFYGYGRGFTITVNPNAEDVSHHISVSILL